MKLSLVPFVRHATSSRRVPWALAAVLLGLAQPALAHAPPVALRLLFPSVSGGPPLVVGNRGLVLPGADGRLLLCNEAYGVTTSLEPAVLEQSGGERLLVANLEAVQRSDDGGCSWKNVSPAPGRTLTAALAPGAAPQALLVATGSSASGNALFRTGDFGDTWQRLHDNAAGQWFTSLVQAPGDPTRLYASVTVADYDAGMLRYGVGASIDGGESWTFSPTTEEKRTVLGVHPGNPDIVFAQSQRTDTGEWALLRSTDGGASYAEVATSVAQFTALALAPDGSSLWLGAGLGGGLLASGDDGASFSPVTDTDVTAVHCLQWQAGRLWMCANRTPNEEGVWSQPEGGGPGQPELTFDEVTQPVDCSVEPASDVCEQPWDDWAYEVLGERLPDGGTAQDAGAGDAGAIARDGGPMAAADAAAPPPEPGAGGCSAARYRADGGLALALYGLLGLAWAWRRSNRRCQGLSKA